MFIQRISTGSYLKEAKLNGTMLEECEWGNVLTAGKFENYETILKVLESVDAGNYKLHPILPLSDRVRAGDACTLIALADRLQALEELAEKLPVREWRAHLGAGSPEITNYHEWHQWIAQIRGWGWIQKLENGADIQDTYAKYLEAVCPFRLLGLKNEN